MRLKEIYRMTVGFGISQDPRGPEEVRRYLYEEKEVLEGLKEENKRSYDQESLWNPYSDTRILYGDEDTEVRSALVGIDIDSAEITLADRLREKGHRIDLVISHHPIGKALAKMHEVMRLQEAVFANCGIPINIAQGLMQKRINEVERQLMPENHNRPVDAARILNIPLMCVHTPADNAVNTYLQNLLRAKEPRYVKDVMKVLQDIPEYRFYGSQGIGPKIVAGKEENRCGKVLVNMTGGTSGAKEILEHLSNHGIGTVIEMHMDEKHREEAEKCFVNVVIAGHAASDSLGMNLVMDKLVENGVKVIPFSGFYRVQR